MILLSVTIASVAKLFSMKVDLLYHAEGFLSSEVVIYNDAILPSIENIVHIMG